MEKYHSRSVFDLTNKEIIKLVDFLVDQNNVDRIAHYFYNESNSLSRDLTYRKIEVKHACYDWAYTVIVTLQFTQLNRSIKTGFILLNNCVENEIGESDFQISSIDGFFRPIQPVMDIDYSTLNVDFDYSHYLVYTKKLFSFLDNDLKMWSDRLTSDKYELNPQLMGLYQKDGQRSFIVEELTEISDNKRLLSLSL